MVKIFVDDVREAPNGFIRLCTTDDTLRYVRQMYKSGTTNFYLDLDNDASNDYSSFGGDYINILKRLEDMRHNGKIRNMNLSIHIHSMNPVATENMRAIIEANNTWMKEVN